MPDVAPDKTKACAEAMPVDEPYRLQQAMLTDMGPCPAKTAEGTIFEAIPVQARHSDIRHATAPPQSMNISRGMCAPLV